LAETGGANTETGLKLYKACVLPHLTYAYPAWCSVSTGSLAKIESVQYQALLAASGAMKGTSSQALEVLCNVMPLRLKFEQEVMMELARIKRKSDDHPLRSLCDKLSSDANFMRHDIITPLHHMAAYEKQSQKRNCNFKDIEKHAKLSPNELFLHGIDIDDSQWRGLGNSNNRTADQLSRARAILDNKLANLEEQTLVAFTDGSALNNPGPCGAAAVIYRDGLSSDPIILEKPISARGSSYEAEIHAIALATSYALTHADNSLSSVHIFSDCQSALKVLHSNNLKDSPTVTNILQDVSLLIDLGISVKGSWVCGHADLKPMNLQTLMLNSLLFKPKMKTLSPKSLLHKLRQ
jgi:ribonuclease HI